MSSEKRERQRANLAGSRVEEAREQQATARRQRRFLMGGIGALIIATAGAVYAFGGDGSPTVAGDAGYPITNAADDVPAPEATPAPSADPAPAPADGECPATDGSSPRTIDFGGPQPNCIDPSEDHVAVFDTSEGEIRVQLDTAGTPLTANNFVTLARWGYYNNTTIFRTDPSIDIIQGGSPHTESPSDQGPGYTIPDEPTFAQDAGGNVTGPYRYEAGQLVMARSGGPDAASAQFFFTTGSNASLLDGQGSYVVFGTTDDAGLAVLREIISLHVATGNLGGAPSRQVTINSVVIEVG